MSAPTEALIQDYRGQLEQLLPPGILWRVKTTSTLRSLLEAVATEFARVDQRSADLILESDPRQTVELLEDWEKFLNLPAPCGALENSRALRRFAVVARLTKQGGQSAAFFVELAAALGFTITAANIEEHKTFRAGPQTCPATTGGANDCGSKAGDKLAASPLGTVTGSYLWAWTVHAPEHTGQFFLAGEGAAGEALVVTGNELLECTFGESKPAHTVVLFAYDQPWEGYAPWTTITPGPAICSASTPPGVNVDLPT